MEEKLKLNKTDYITSSLRAILGPLPIVGPFFQELISTIIPNQRIDRLSEFAQILNDKLESLHLKVNEALISDENFTLLTEESLKEAMNSSTKIRREYISNILASGIQSANIDFNDHRRILQTLASINDIEVIILLSYTKFSLESRELYQKHEPIFKYSRLMRDANQEEIDKNALYKNYLENLANLGLLIRQYKWPTKGFADESRRFEQPEIEFRITNYGKLLLRTIGLNGT